MNRAVKTLGYFAGLVGLAAALSLFFSGLWGGKAEKGGMELFEVSPGMTARQFARGNGVPEAALAELLGAKGAAGLDEPLSSYKVDEGKFFAELFKRKALWDEEGSKNWRKIALKFALWFVFLGVVFALMRAGRITFGLRNVLYLSAVAVFGVLLGADPSPMGTVKDAIALYGAKHLLFKPRFVALAVFLLLTVLANKFICSWGCQLGALQDFIFRLNGGPDRRPGLLRQFKPSFAFTNTVRALFFGVFTVVALGWGFDLIGPVDPFKFYNPSEVTLAGWGLIGAVLLGSLFVYRPWCHLFCPFGLVGWLAEKASVFKIKVNYDTCVACEACAGACPSTVMGAILKRGRTVPDCFACGECIAVCPTRSISLAAGRRALPPPGKFSGLGLQKP